MPYEVCYIRILYVLRRCNQLGARVLSAAKLENTRKVRIGKCGEGLAALSFNCMDCVCVCVCVLLRVFCGLIADALTIRHLALTLILRCLHDCDTRLLGDDTPVAYHEMMAYFKGAAFVGFGIQ